MLSQAVHRVKIVVHVDVNHVGGRWYDRVMGKRTTRVPARLDAPAIVDAAIRVMDADGLDALTMRRLGREMGADPTAMYRHFRSKDELLLAVCDRLLGSMLDALEPGDGWRSTLRDMSWTAWRTY